MLESIRIEGFRKYKDFSLGGFDKINFILGNNNIGKTSILEAIFAWACGQNVAPFIHIPLARGRYTNIQNPYWVMEELLATVNERHTLPLKMVFEGVFCKKLERFDHIIYPSDLLTDYDSSYKNELVKYVPRTNEALQDQSAVSAGFPGIGSFSPVVVANWEISHNEKKVTSVFTAPYTSTRNTMPFQSAKYIDLLSFAAVNENVQMYATLKRERLLQEVADEMRRIFPQIKGFDMIPYPDGSQSPVSIENQDGSFLPMYAYGDGVQKWFYVLGSLALYKKYIVCVDEVDAGFHPAAQVSFCTSVIQTAIRNDVQLFLTTHNIEFMDNLLQSVVANECSAAESIRIITLRDTKEGLRARNMSAKEAYEAREIYNMELR